MSNFIKLVLSLFFMLVTAIVAISAVTANVEASTAREYMDSAKKEISDAHYADAVVEEVKKAAEDNGYEITVTLYESGNMPAHTESAAITLTYQYKIPILGIENTHTLRGFVN